MSDLGTCRLQAVRDHMALEITQDWDGVIATFDHPRYELYGSSAVFDGEDAVRRYFAASRTPFPDQGNEIITIAHAGNTVLAEFWLTGTHLGPLVVGGRTIAPAGRKFRVRMAASFGFRPGSGRILCERPYFDQGAVLRALELAWPRAARFALSNRSVRAVPGRAFIVCTQAGSPCRMSAASDQRRTLESAARWNASRM
ncbi:MAG: ester cyclase [Hyphomonas sp.]|jgi:ketosteroid isomerase-like protein